MSDEQTQPKSDVTLDGDQSSGGDLKGSTLTPMLIAGLILVVIGGLVVMIFV